MLLFRAGKKRFRPALLVLSISAISTDQAGSVYLGRPPPFRMQPQPEYLWAQTSSGPGGSRVNCKMPPKVPLFPPEAVQTTVCFLSHKVDSFRIFSLILRCSTSERIGVHSRSCRPKLVFITQEGRDCCRPSPLQLQTFSSKACSRDCWILRSIVQSRFPGECC